jgi:hypothetical protein
LPYLPHWRWLLDREDSPWYPSMRLFRQTSPGDWPGVAAKVARELCQWAGSKASQVADRLTDNLKDRGS